MSQYTKEWCRTFYNTMWFMELLLGYLKRCKALKVQRGSWNFDRRDDGTGATSAYFLFWPANVKKEDRQDYAGFYFSISPDEPERGYPLWIWPDTAEDIALRDRFQAAFPENMVIQDDWWEVGLPLDIPADATEEQISAIAKGLADKVIQAMEGLAR